MNSLKPYLEESLTSIVKNIPVNKLIVVDSFSTDDTIPKILSHKEINSKIIQVESSRGQAREIGIRNVETKLFAFVDSDVILADGWFDKIMLHLTSSVGAIEGNVKTIDGKVQKIKQNRRGYTNCTLIRSEVVEGIVIPEEIQVYEDQYIRRFIERNGFKWLKVSEPCSIHASATDKLGNAFEIGRISGKYRLDPFWREVTTFLFTVVKKTIGLESDDPKISYLRIKGHIKGVYERFHH